MTAPLAIGIDLGGTKVFGGLVDAGGQVTNETYVAHDDGDAVPAGHDPALWRVLQTVRALQAAVARAGRAVTGVGVGAPGVIRPDGTVVSAMPLGWRDFPLRARLAEALALPVVVDNDVNLIAVGEHRFGAGRGTRTLVCLAVGTGIGGAVIVDGKLHRGANGAAGEVGAMLPGLEHLSWRDPHWGALESLASGTGLAARARAATGDASARAEDVFRAARDGAPWATTLIEQTIDYLALAVASIQSLLDPERIVLAGGMAAEAAWIIPGIEQRLAGALPFPPRLVPGALGYRAGVLGAAALVGV